MTHARGCYADGVRTRSGSHPSRDRSSARTIPSEQRASAARERRHENDLLRRRIEEADLLALLVALGRVDLVGEILELLGEVLEVSSGGFHLLLLALVPRLA